MQQMDWTTHNIVNDNLEALKQFFPEAFSEDKVDFEKLQLLLWTNISNDKEKYSFSWKGKNDAIKLALAQNTWTLRPDKESSKNWDITQNLYIEWDNLEVLRTLQDSYRWQVKMIYIDPPYNTWKDFVYKDDFHDNVSSYKEKMWENMKSNPETNGRYHTDWLNMMYPRLKLARNLLKNDWVIFISIDDNEVHNLRKICDEIFGEENFIVEMIWQSKSWWWHDEKLIVKENEYILAYSKHKNITKLWRKIDYSWDEKYKLKDEFYNIRWWYLLNKLDRRMTSSHYTESLNYPIKMPDDTEIWPWWNSERSNEWWNWRWWKDKLKWWIENKFIDFAKNNWKWSIYSKQYQFVDNNNEIIERSLPYRNVILSSDFSTTQWSSEIVNLFWYKIFEYAKSSKLIKYFLEIWLLEQKDIILDFFSWSWTTAHAVMKLNSEDWWNRKFIMVQIPEETATDSEAYKAWYKNICEIWKERIRRSGEKILQENKDKEWIKNLDVWFKVFKLDTTNLKKWETSIEWETENEIKKELQMRLQDMTNPVKEDRKQIDMVYEIMLKNGMDLSLHMQELNINWKKVFSIADNYLIACLEKNIDLETVKEIANLNPKVAVFYDDSFADDRVKINAIQNLEKSEIQIRVI